MWSAIWQQSSSAWGIARLMQKLRFVLIGAALTASISVWSAASPVSLPSQVPGSDQITAAIERSNAALRGYEKALADAKQRLEALQQRIPNEQSPERRAALTRIEETRTEIAVLEWKIDQTKRDIAENEARLKEALTVEAYYGRRPGVGEMAARRDAFESEYSDLLRKMRSAATNGQSGLRLWTEFCERWGVSNLPDFPAALTWQNTGPVITKCVTCGGRGTCPTCQGKGEVNKRCDRCGGTCYIHVSCAECNGTGHIGYSNCPYCRGTGRKDLYRCPYCYNGSVSVPCDRCKGTGRCPQCNGTKAQRLYP